MTALNTLSYYPGQKNRYSREIYEVDRRSDHVISCDIELRFDSDATRGSCVSRAGVADRSRCREISHDRTADQSHEYLGCNDFFGQGSRCVICRSGGLEHWASAFFFLWTFCFFPRAPIGLVKKKVTRNIEKKAHGLRNARKNSEQSTSSTRGNDPPSHSEWCVLTAVPLCNTQRAMGLVCITSWYPNFNGSHFGLPPSQIHRMTGLPPKSCIRTGPIVQKRVSTRAIRMTQNPTEGVYVDVQRHQQAPTM